MSNEGLSGLT